MDTGVIIVIVVVLLLCAVAAYFITMKQKQSSQLRGRYGSEYEETVSSRGDRGAAEKDLQAREQRVQRLHIKEIPEEQRSKYADQWRIAQVHFVDDPSGAIGEADKLVELVMNARGYPITNFEQQAADVSVDHADVVSNYRAAHKIADANRQNGATTEELRQAMVHYRALFTDLLGVKTAV
jgi:hypothetical protein